MPLVDWNSAASYVAAYDIGGEPEGHPSTRDEVRLHYTRAALWQDAQARAAKYVELLSLTTDDRIAIVGCGFGWTVEALVALGFEAAGADPSSYIQGNKGTSEEAEIDAEITRVGLDPASGEGAAVKAKLITRGGGSGPRSRATVANEDLATAGSRNAVRRLFNGNRVTVAITEDLLPWMTDAEIATQASRVASLDPSNLRMIAHYVTPAGPGNFLPYNWKTGQSWRAFLDSLGLQSHRLIIAGSYEFL